jgi:hypothetical protein
MPLQTWHDCAMNAMCKAALSGSGKRAGAMLQRACARLYGSRVLFVANSSVACSLLLAACVICYNALQLIPPAVAVLQRQSISSWPLCSGNALHASAATASMLQHLLS